MNMAIEKNILFFFILLNTLIRLDNHIDDGK
ncbi:hypothetical protein C7433_1011275 [Pantoea sp. PNA 03-3]|nr:hypothetical protein C7433_1011275 [Pantoea sp. PNA 03-3]